MFGGYLGGAGSLDIVGDQTVNDSLCGEGYLTVDGSLFGSG